MGVPQEIRDVERPTNTIVQENRSSKGVIYSVRKRDGYFIDEKGNPCPINSCVIGHIINGKYVPILEEKDQLPEKLSFGAEYFIHSVANDIYDDLLKSFDYKDASSILVTAMLRVIEPGIASSRLASEYSTSYLSAYYPGVALSKNHISDLIEDIGRYSRKMTHFFQLRIERVGKEHHILIDGTLVQDNSTVNDLSAFSHKFRMKGVKDISVIYAYDAELKEPICAQVFPGNMLDASAFPKFIEQNNLTKGILVADKGFPITQIEKYLKETERKDMHFISPIRRNDSRIAINNMYDDWEGFLKNTDKAIKYKKEKIQVNRWLYSFKDVQRAEEEEEVFNKKYKRNNKVPTKADMEKCGKESGTITFVSDLDLTPEEVYSTYDDRWELETVFKTFKQDLCITKTNVQNNFSVEGTQFINFISALLTCRLINKIKKAELFETYSFNGLMKVLSKMWRKVIIEDGLMKPAPEPKGNDKYWAVYFKYIYDLMEKLELFPKKPKNKTKKKGEKTKKN